MLLNALRQLLMKGGIVVFDNLSLHKVAGALDPITAGRVLDLLFVGPRHWCPSLPPAYVRAARSRPYDVQSNIFGTLP